MQTVELVEREASQPNGLTLFPLAAAHLEGLVIDGLLLAQPHNYSDALAAEPVPAGLGLCGRLWAHRGAARRVMVDRRSRGAGRRQRADPAGVLEHDRVPARDPARPDPRRAVHRALRPHHTSRG